MISYSRPMDNLAVSSPHQRAVDFGLWSVTPVQTSQYDAKGRQTHYRESPQQRNARLQFLRQQEFYRRLALSFTDHKFASTSTSTAPKRYTIEERASAARKIQRAFRAYIKRRNVLTEIEGLAALLDEYLDSIPTPASRSPRSKRSLLHHDLSLRECEDQLMMLRDELQEIMRTDDFLVRREARKLLIIVQKELKALEERKVDTWVQELEGASHMVKKAIDEERRERRSLSGQRWVDVQVPRLEVSRNPRRPVSRQPSLASVAEESEF